jgi:hypothetical protein
VARIKIEHYAEGTVCEGAIALKGIRVFPVLWPAKLIGLRIGKRAVYLDRENALEVATALRSAAHDG